MNTPTHPALRGTVASRRGRAQSVSTKGARGATTLKRRTRTVTTGILIAALAIAGTILGPTTAAFADDYPTWDDVQAARSSESAKGAEVQRINAIISDLQQKAAAAQALVEQRSAEDEAAQAALAAGQSKADSLAASAATWQTKADTSSRQAALIAATFARSAGSQNITSLLLGSDSSEASDLLSQLSSMGKLSETITGIYDQAKQDANTAASVSAQAQVAKDALAGLAAAAQAALEQAAAAQRDLIAALNEQSAHQEELYAQLASLQSNTATTEAQYQAGVEARAAAARAAAAAAAAARAAGSGVSVGPVSGDQQALAQELMDYVASGQFRGSYPDHIFEISYIAAGKSVPNCGIDTVILQAMVTAVRAFGSAAVSDISRRCTGQIEGAGTASAHYRNGGGHAVDFIAVGGVGLNGSNNASINLIKALDPIMPYGSGLGQRNCRTSAGTEPSLKNFSDFYDTCNHLHVDDF
ncbi:hypothetical protein B7R54_12565 [Subtercola boreus]|uniref:Uncharacterized protein n=1 Tax=Subtercola boreus TaxID=120213 RepID=A0A3E0VJU7_9MICO|nr:hypothetical protein [Subtercola boreus]RFA09939.1 hypothetical protein B7R54_12565 [Subtercola boreus]TQL52918.1 peptidoglycan hydrolase CwlO-like protein [Subtercola boreus]